MRKLFLTALTILASAGMWGGVNGLPITWNFSKEYDAVADNGKTTYTPNSTSITKPTSQQDTYTIGYYNYADNQPTFMSNVGNAPLKIVSATNWKLGAGYGNQTLMFKPSAQSSITDFTDPTQHDYYFETSFDASSYSNIQLTMAACYTANVDGEMHIVVSVDGGTTWKDVYTYTDAGNWWTYTQRTTSLPAAGKSNVIVRIVRGTGWQDASKEWKLSYLSISGEAMDPTKAYISYVNNDPAVVGIVPENATIVAGNYTFPKNQTLYKEEYTLIGWTNGETTFNAGQQYNLVAGAYDLTPVFRQNTETLAETQAEVTIHWEFQTKEGAPTIEVQGNTTILVTQATVNGQVIDVCLTIDATTTSPTAKFQNKSNNDWAQVNSATKFYFPSVASATLRAFILNEPKSQAEVKSTLDGNEYTSFANNKAEWTAAPTDGISTLIIQGGSWYRYFDLIVPPTTYTRNVIAGNYGTICLPYAVGANDYSGCVLFNLVEQTTGSDNKLASLTFEEETGDLVAGKPYLFRATDNTIAFQYAAGTYTSQVVEANGLVGNLGERHAIAHGNYIISGSMFYYVDSEVYVGTYRAYIDASKITNQSYAPDRVVVFGTKNPIATGVENTTAVKATKALVNGKLVIRRGNKTFDVNGNPLSLR